MPNQSAATHLPEASLTLTPDAALWRHRWPQATFVPSRVPIIREVVKARAVLHVGCADWPLTHVRHDQLLHRTIAESAGFTVGLDLRLEALAAASKSCLATPVVAADVAFLPIAARSFDVVLLAEVIEHLGEPLRSLWECHRILRPGGSLLLTTPSAQSLLHNTYSWLAGSERIHEDHVALYSPRTLTALLERAEFEPRSWWTFQNQDDDGSGGGFLNRLVSPMARFRPFLAPGIIVQAVKVPR